MNEQYFFFHLTNNKKLAVFYHLGLQNGSQNNLHLSYAPFKSKSICRH